jgi:hypothetical protein
MPLRNCRWSLFPLSLVFFLSLTSSAEEHSAPMEMRRDMPFVQVTINGQGPFTFGIDTGTGGQALVTPELIQKLKLTTVGESEVGDPSGRNSHKVPLVQIGSLTVAGVEFKNVKATQHTPSQREGPCDGILGFVLFRDYLFTLDYPKQELRLANGTLKPDSGEQVIPFTMPNDVPLIDLKVGTRTLSAHVDSRGRGLSIPAAFASDLKFQSEPIVIGRGRTVSNEFEIKGAQLAGDVRLGGYTFPTPFVEINPIFPVGNFGAVPLQHFAVTFDQKSGLMRLIAESKSIVLPPPAAVPHKAE